MSDVVPFVDLAGLHRELRPEIDAAIAGVIDSGAFILGPDVAAFEDEFAAYCEARHCIGVASGTAALHLAYQALGVGPGDEVIVPANTFVATVFPVLSLGATPVLVDCEADTALIDAGAVAAAITPRTKAIAAVHLYGQPADLDALAAIAAQRGIAIVEDAAQAHGARLGGRRVGALATIGCFSFYPGKNLGALGDGGAVTTDDDALAERVRLLRDLGQRRKYDHALPGHNERLDTLQAAVLRVKLRHLDAHNASRRAAADAYAAALGDEPAVMLPSVLAGREPVWHLYVIRAAQRDALRERLDAAGVQSGLHYPVPVHLQDACRDLGHRTGDFPNAERWSDEGVSLPMFAGLRDAQVQQVAQAIRASVQSPSR